MARWVADVSTSDKLLGSVWIPFVARWGSLMWRFILIFSSASNPASQNTRALNQVSLYLDGRYGCSVLTAHRLDATVQCTDPLTPDRLPKAFFLGLGADRYGPDRDAFTSSHGVGHSRSTGIPRLTRFLCPIALHCASVSPLR